MPIRSQHVYTCLPRKTRKDHFIPSPLLRTPGTKPACQAVTVLQLTGTYLHTPIHAFLKKYVWTVGS